MPEIRVDSLTTDTISISWTTPNGSVVENYEITWSVQGSFGLFQHTLSNNSNEFTIAGLEEYESATISITVTAHNIAGSTTSSRLMMAANLASGQQPAGFNNTMIGVISGAILTIVLILILAAIIICYVKSKFGKTSKR